MNELFPILAIFLFLGTIISIFVVLTVLSHRKLEIEKGKTALYKQTRGGVIGVIRFRGPLISLRVYEEFIFIGCGKQYVLRYHDIDRVEIKEFLGFATRIQIIHHNPDVPSKILLGTKNATKLKELIEARLGS